MPNEAWKEIFEDFGIPYRQRNGASQALMARCIFHDEKTPSLWAHPSGNYICYGCGKEGTIEDFDDQMKEGVSRILAREVKERAERAAWNALSPDEKERRHQETIKNAPF